MEENSSDQPIRKVTRVPPEETDDEPVQTQTRVP